MPPISTPQCLYQKLHKCHFSYLELILFKLPLQAHSIFFWTLKSHRAFPNNFIWFLPLFCITVWQDSPTCYTPPGITWSFTKLFSVQAVCQLAANFFEASGSPLMVITPTFSKANMKVYYAPGTIRSDSLAKYLKHCSAQHIVSHFVVTICSPMNLSCYCLHFTDKETVRHRELHNLYRVTELSKVTETELDPSLFGTNIYLCSESLPKFWLNTFTH